MGSKPRNLGWPLPILVGAFFWTTYVYARVPNLLDETWAQALILFAALVVLPLAWDLVPDEGTEEADRRLSRVAKLAALPAAILLSLAFRLSQGPMALLAALPWGLVLVLRAVQGLRGLVRSRSDPARFAFDVGLAYGGIGAAWTLADRAGFRPLDFDPTIVLLTAAHFHVAGIVLPILAGCACKHLGSRALAVAVPWLVAAGVILVAIGITASKLQMSHAIEGSAAVALSLSGLVVAFVQLRMAAKPEFPFGAQVCLGLSAIGLVAGMALSFLYGIRYVAMPLPWLDLPWMRALHGTANAVGFGFFGVVGWRLARRDR